MKRIKVFVLTAVFLTFFIASGSLSLFAVNADTSIEEIVVVLDPGHDSTHDGASANGVDEVTTNLKIAQYCMEELEKYTGVKVYMTRYSTACAFGKSLSEKEELIKRVEYGASVGADIFVSIHINASSSSSAKGVQIIYPNSNYRKSLADEAKKLSDCIMNQLVAAGLSKNSMYIKNSTINTLYPDGSLADYYRIIEQCKRKNIPGIIVEHGFLTNASDAKFLKSEANLKALGIADATGIAEYLGLAEGNPVELATPVLKSAEPASSGVKVTWTAVNKAKKYRVYRKVSGGSWSRIAETSSTSYTDTTAEFGKTYIYTVRALRGIYISGYDSGGVSLTYLKTPTLSSAVTSACGVKVTWKSVSGATKYRVYRKVSGESWSRIAETTSTSYTDKSSLKSNTTYIYTVRVINSDGVLGSYYDKSGVGVTYLEMPSLNTASVVATGVKISWTKISGAKKYRVYRKVSGGSWEKLVETSSTSYTDKTAKTGTTYYYTVRALNGSITSPHESPGAKMAYLKTPSLGSASLTTGGVKLTWNSVSGAAKYRVYRKASGGSWARLSDVDSTSYVDATAKDGVTYIYTVRAINSDGIIASYYDTDGLSITTRSMKG